MKKNTVDVDVIIPCKNDHALLKVALDSLERQTVSFNKCIVVDDWSDIGISNEMFKPYSNFTLQITRNSGTGLASARNTGILLSESQFVAFLDSDDYWEEGKLDRQVTELESSAEYVGAVTGCLVKKSSGEVEKILVPKKNRGSLEDILNGSFLISGSASSIILRRNVFDKTGHFDTSLGYAEDMDLWLRIARVGDFIGIQEPLTNILIRTDSIQRLGNESEKSEREFNAKSNILSVYSDYPKHVAKQLIYSASKVAFANRLKPKILRDLYQAVSTNSALQTIRIRSLSYLGYFFFCLLSLFLIQVRDIYSSLKSKVSSYFGTRYRGWDSTPFIFTEVYGCGQLGRIMGSSYLTSGIDYMQYPLNIFGYKRDLREIPESPGLVKINLGLLGLSGTRIVNNLSLKQLFKRGHRGTAALWLAVIRRKKDGNVIHLDSDIILLGDVVNTILGHINNGAALVGSARPYKKNAQGIAFDDEYKDLVQTSAFAFQIQPWMRSIRLISMFRMILGTYDYKSRKILDFFDPLSMKILDNGGKIEYLDFNSVGGINRSGSRKNIYEKLNDFNTLRKIDVGSDMVHFSAVGSGINVYNNKRHKVPFEYASYALDRYALYSSIFFNDDLGRDLTEYSELISQFKSFLAGRNKQSF